jgi:hypothetical protein
LTARAFFVVVGEGSDATDERHPCDALYSQEKGHFRCPYCDAACCTNEEYCDHLKECGSGSDQAVALAGADELPRNSCAICEKVRPGPSKQMLSNFTRR